MERGATKSGGRFSKQNKTFYSSVGEVLYHHKSLLNETPVFTTKLARVENAHDGNLEITTARFKFGYPHIRQSLNNEFIERFREHKEGPDEGFEVIVTFNAILQHKEASSYSLFYGQDYRTGNVDRAARELRYGNEIIVKTLPQVALIPTVFDADSLLRAHRHAFDDSGVSVHSFLNVIYLIYRSCKPYERSKRDDNDDGDLVEHSGGSTAKRKRVN